MPAGVPTDIGRKDRSIVIVGGGIAGLYAAYLLGRLDYHVQLFELSDRWGGRIDSQIFKLDGRNDFIAEFGPMRFEAHLQERLRRLCFHLGIDFEPFSPTSAPVGTTHYDLTATEESLKSPADLLQWAVLKMFFKEDVKTQLAAIEEPGKPMSRRDRERVGPRQLSVLKKHMDEKLFCNVNSGGKPTITARTDAEIQDNLEELRENATLRGQNGTPLLARLGLWNALSEVISPGALARIRDSGTFYHFIAQNPSALEWGIFWLRQASVMGDLFRFDRNDAANGTHSLVRKLVRRIELECPTVRLHLGREVVRITHGKRSDEVILRVVCHDKQADTYSFNQPVDDVILALPRQPLLKLAEHFPTDVLKRVEGVVAMPLLKAFLVMKNPWWRHHLKAQTFAWLVPTRELHFFRPDAADCPRLDDPEATCTCDDKLSADAKKTGMIMLYTDEPAIKYWQALMTPGQRGQTTWERYPDGRKPQREVRAHPDGLLATLIRRLVMIPDPGLARAINVREPGIMKTLRKRDPALARKIALARGGAGKLAEQIFNATRNDKAGRATVARVLREKEIDVDPDWHEWLKFAIEYAKFELNVEARTEELAEEVRAFGIRDWSATPFGGASHVWLPAETPLRRGEPDPLIAFGLRGRAGSVHDSNVHICGEAYSTFQGFIEGALRTAEEVVDTIAGVGAASAVFSLDKNSKANEKEAIWIGKQPTELTERWTALP